MQTSPFHVGEQAVQSRLGVRETIEPWARQVVRPFLPEQHREFYAQLPFIVAAARDEHDRPWATLLTGPPGFVRSPDTTSLHFATTALPGDALAEHLTAGADLGLLGIGLATRRRNRVNGTITSVGETGIGFAVAQTFGNCPQYITEREWRQVDVDPAAVTASRHRRLDDEMQAWIASADTMFVASGYRDIGDNGDDGGDNPAYGMDASHRGGAAGFIQVLSDTRLVFPDYAGNNHFNTLGNLQMDPRVGLLFVDFENGSLLQLTGKATIDWDSDEIANHTGARRLVIVDVHEIVRLDRVLPLRWSEPRGFIRSLRLLQKTRESDDVTSFEFASRDGGELPDFDAGQHLPLELHVDGQEQPVRRTYSLSNGPGQGRYRISVKREPHGLVSRHLHDNVEVGDIVSSRKPDGEFVLEHSGRPAVLLSAGIGVTPMVSMLHALTADENDRPVYFIHGARDGSHHALADEVRDIADLNDNVHLVVAYSQPAVNDVEGLDYDRRGRVTGKLVEEVVSDLDADFYLCGPTRFLADVTAALGDLGVGAERIHTETF